MSCFNLREYFISSGIEEINTQQQMVYSFYQLCDSKLLPCSNVIALLQNQTELQGNGLVGWSPTKAAGRVNSFLSCICQAVKAAGSLQTQKRVHQKGVLACSCLAPYGKSLTSGLWDLPLLLCFCKEPLLEASPFQALGVLSPQPLSGQTAAALMSGGCQSLRPSLPLCLPRRVGFLCFWAPSAAVWVLEWICLCAVSQNPSKALLHLHSLAQLLAAKAKAKAGPLLNQATILHKPYFKKKGIKQLCLSASSEK